MTSHSLWKILPLLVLVISGVAHAQAVDKDSFLFGNSPIDAFGNPAVHHSQRYHNEGVNLINHHYAPLTTDFGSDRPTPLRILIKDDTIASPLTQTYVDTLSNEKSYLMAIYKLNDRDYNRLAAIAFGILGRESKFGKSFLYGLKEGTRHPKVFLFPVPIAVELPPMVTMAKAAKKTVRNVAMAIWHLDPAKYLGTGAWSIPDDSRGLTQIKNMPGNIVHYYCADLDQLNNPRVTAIATLGFLAESLKVLRNRARNMGLMYVNEKNLFDYVLYVYFGSIGSQLVNPILGYDGTIVRDAATPQRNQYVIAVRQYIRSLAFFEAKGYELTRHTDSACRIPGDN